MELPLQCKWSPAMMTSFYYNAITDDNHCNQEAERNQNLEQIKMPSFRQLEQRHVSAEISLMEWNPTLDLIALATTSGEVLLHRLSWQKVWSVPSSKEENLLITSMAWRPDGKILAYGHDNGKVVLCDVENAEMVHMLEVHCKVTSLTWVQCVEEINPEATILYVDRSEQYLLKHYASNKAYASTSKQSEEVEDDFKKMKGQKELNMLAVGMETGIVHLHSFGMFPTGSVEVNLVKDDPVHSRVKSVTLSKDFKILAVVLEREVEGSFRYYYRSYHMSLLSDKMQEIKVISLKYGQISSLLTYLSSTIRAISEAWEDILMEVDTKLHNYALQKEGEEASISDDFMELLMFGNPSDSLEKFLMHDLTEGGLKKFGHSIELSYSNIQKLVLKRLQSVTSSLYYHLCEFGGMAEWTFSFDELGLSEEKIHAAAMMTGSFLIKATEIQQVIDSSMKNFKAFFRWLYSVILRLSDEPVPVEVSKLTQQDLQFVAEFLQDNFVDKVDEDGRKTVVKLERVAQYLKKEDLQYPASTAGNPWIKFLESTPEMQSTGLIFKSYPEKSLVTLYEDLKKAIDVAVKGTWNLFNDTVTLHCFHPLYQSKEACLPKISHVGCAATRYLYTVITDQSTPCSKFFLLREHSKKEELAGMAVTFQKSNEADSEDKNKNYKILDVKFYSEHVISVLLVEDEVPESDCPVLFQLPLRSLTPELKPLVAKCQAEEAERQLGDIAHTVNACQFLEKGSYKRMENVRADHMAVSGSRKVVCVLFASKRQVRLFEMDVEEDEEDADDSVVKMEAVDSDEDKAEL